MNVGVGVMARAPSSGGKSRLAAHVSAPRLSTLRSAMLADTLVALASVPHLTIFFTPADAEDEIRAFASGLPGAPQIDGDLGARMLAAIRHLLDGHRFDAAILVGADIPLLTADHIADSSAQLRDGADVVLGPADDGGYYLIGMKEPHAQLFEAIEWGSERVLTETRRAAARGGLETRLVRRGYDVDTIEDLRRVERDLAMSPASGCPNLRRWLSES